MNDEFDLSISLLSLYRQLHTIWQNSKEQSDENCPVLAVLMWSKPYIFGEHSSFCQMEIPSVEESLFFLEFYFVVLLQSINEIFKLLKLILLITS